MKFFHLQFFDIGLGVPRYLVRLGIPDIDLPRKKPDEILSTEMTSAADSMTETAPLLSHNSHNGNSSSITTTTSFIVKLASAMYSFFTLGLFVASVGVVLPHLEAFYTLTDTQVSLIFLVVPIGYISAAQLNDLIHRNFGQRGVATLGPIFQLVAAVIVCSHPPFWLLLVGHVIVAFGAGLLDGSWCAWAAAMSNTISGLLHGSFSVGAAAGPFLAGSVIEASGRPWYMWYYVLVRMSTEYSKVVTCS